MDDRNAALYESRWSMTRQVIAEVIDGGEADLSRLLHQVGARISRKQTVGPAVYQAFGLEPGTVSLAMRRLARGFVADTVLDHAAGADVIIELGAGWGWNLFNLWVRGGPAVPYCVLEPTEAGRACAAAIAARFPGPDIRVRPYDFLEPDLPPLQDVRHALVFTSHAIDKVLELPARAIEQIVACAPQVTVLHFEALHAQLDPDTQVPQPRNLNRNLIALLRDAEAQGRLAIEEIRPSTLGGVSSLVRWTASRG